MVNDKQLSYIFMVGKSDSKYLNKQLETEGKSLFPKTQNNMAVVFGSINLTILF